MCATMEKSLVYPGRPSSAQQRSKPLRNIVAMLQSNLNGKKEMVYAPARCVQPYSSIHVATSLSGGIRLLTGIQPVWNQQYARPYSPSSPRKICHAIVITGMALQSKML